MDLVSKYREPNDDDIQITRREVSLEFFDYPTRACPSTRSPAGRVGADCSRPEPDGLVPLPSYWKLKTDHRRIPTRDDGMEADVAFSQARWFVGDDADGEVSRLDSRVQYRNTRQLQLPLASPTLVAKQD